MSHAPTKMQRNIHSHTWVVGLVGLAVGLYLLIYVPSMKVVSSSLLLFAGFHLLGGIVTLGSLYVIGGRKLWRRAHHPAPQHNRIDYGWGTEWMNGLAVAAVITFALAILLQINHPQSWPLAFLIVLLGASFVVGNFVMLSFRSRDYAVLPMVPMLRGDNDLVLDAGCGTGRTTIALSRLLGNGRVVAVDRFDAGYINEGGRALLDHNLQVTGLTDRVTIEKADLTALPFDEGHFDSAISTNVFDHLGPHKQQSLNEVYRVLKPGSRFLLAVWTPGWPMFAIGNLFSFLLTSRSQWQEMAQRSGFTVRDQGVFNFAWFVLLEKPSTPETNG